MENYSDLADRWLWGISEAIKLLRKFPEKCPVSPESAAFDVVVRQLSYGKKPHTYRILFSIQDEKVYILRIRSAKQRSVLDE